MNNVLSGRVSVVKIVGASTPADGTLAGVRGAWEASGVEYHPTHGAVLSADARPWMPGVRRFYERQLVGVDLITANVSTR